ncbi:trehalose-6-phosphate hydrolase [Pseudobutyrivibrio sp. NOR37]|uniref:Alpha,alpha-phosphotrehalase n=1 Tax=Pseudobutyrivibrio xylanivorans TaxID=185007 RepID=A0A6M0LE95_PSEXY|nr:MULTISPECIES: alpha,alpha-phosphotrehalase [Pseudobutyrivibrio]NEX00766.1 alpha,alpha-phosphotrehalase [Pseudobutyrivibrio xylanivorans]SFR62544.1 trehalose-6-phosphate hydrolase [Pseudobutyrivibrio sp. NOR37]
MLDFKDKVVYQIYPRSFYDTNGDGFGDLKGITAKLDYLKELGVDFLWITPFFISPQRDNGYDIADYRQIDPRFGTMEDFEELSSEAKKRGIGIMLDMVFNHTSTEHQWFQKAISGDEKYINYYKFVDGTRDCPPTNWVSKFGGNAWEYVDSLNKWYLHLFDVTQADLNWDNPEVRDELKDIIRFWKAKGVSGFRFDVINLISKPENLENDYEGDGRRFYTDGPRVHEFLKELVADTGIADMITVGEMSSTTIDNCIKYSNPSEKELSMVFSFHHLKVDYKNGNKWELMPYDKSALKKLFKDWQEQMSKNGGWNAVFWTNHDQPRTISRFGNEEKYWKESGKLFAGIIHFMRGTPYIYQGEEIGMLNTHFTDISQYRDVESLNYFKILQEEGKSSDEALAIINERSRDNCRTPMQWDSSANDGFTTGTPWIEVPEYGKHITAESQINDETSIFSFYKKLIYLRKEYKIISDGGISFDESPEEIISYERKLGDKVLKVVGNLSENEADYSWSDEGYDRLIGNYDSAVNSTKGQIKLRPYEFAVFKNF